MDRKPEEVLPGLNQHLEEKVVVEGISNLHLQLLTSIARAQLTNKSYEICYSIYPFD